MMGIECCMSAKYIFRMDDISWDMNFDNFIRIRDIFIKNGIKPVIGVIPDNKDPKLKKRANGTSISEDDFWNMIRSLQSEHGWDVTMHGYQHAYVTKDSGLLRVNAYSEFAGLPYSEQAEKIGSSVRIFKDRGIAFRGFMAPAHSFDETTLEALRENSINCITDGYSAYPYYRKGMLFVPAQWAVPRKKLYGYHTFVFHINSWQDKHFKRLERFIDKNRSKCISFSEVVDGVESGLIKPGKIKTLLSEKMIIAEKKAFYLVAGAFRKLIK